MTNVCLQSWFSFLLSPSNYVEFGLLDLQLCHLVQVAKVSLQCKWTQDEGIHLQAYIPILFFHHQLVPFFAFCHFVCTGCPKKMLLLPSFEFLTLGEVYLGVKNNSKNFGNKKNIGLLSKTLSKLTLFIGKMQKCWCSYEFLAMFRMENFIVCHKSQYLCIYSYKY